MFRFKLSAILLSLLARLGLAEPNYSILDESNNRWLPDDTIITGLNTIYNSLSRGLQDDDKKKKPLSVIAAAIVEYLSSDLTDEQAKLNSALNALTKEIASRSQDDSVRNKLRNANEATRTSDRDLTDGNSVLRRRNNEELIYAKDYMVKIILNKIVIEVADANNEQCYKYDCNILSDENTNNIRREATSPDYSW